MNEDRRCLYNAIRDKAAAHNGVGCFQSYNELGELCQTNRRQAMALTNELVKSGMLIRASTRTTVRRCYIPLDPDPERNETFFEVVADGNFGVVAMARATFLSNRGMAVDDICRVLSTSCGQIMLFLESLAIHGYWRK